MAPVFWFLGLSASGKSTFARHAREFLEQEKDLFPGVSKWELLDGDSVREFLGSEIGYGYADRRKSVRVMGLMAYYLSRNGIGVVVANISPFHDIRQLIRAHIPSYREIFCRASITTCIARDPKGHYKAQLERGAKDFVGLDIPFQAPTESDLIIETETLSLEECKRLTTSFLQKAAIGLHPQ